MGMSNCNEIIERLENLAKHAVHYVGEPPFVMSLDDGIALHDAIDLLKAQEPRVLSMEEIKSNYVEIFYFETRAGMLRACVKELSDLPGSSIVYLVCGAVDDTYWRDLDCYGITWRAWNRRPTPEQMRDTPWEGEDDE